MDYPSIERWLTQTAPSATGTAAGPIVRSRVFHPLEERAIIGAAPKRTREFRTGRALARAALGALNALPPTDDIIEAGPDRAPVWPKGVVGSITHSDALCIAHVAKSTELAGVGVDAERIAEPGAGMIRLICHAEEWDTVCRQLDHPALAFAVCFSAKESIFKACAPSVQADLDFKDITLDIAPDELRFAGRLVRRDANMVRGRYAVFSDHIVSAAWRRHGGP